MFDIASFLERHVEIQKKTDKEVFLRACPWCGPPGKHESTVSAARNKPIFFCFRCGKKGNWASLISKITGVPFAEAKALISYGLDLEVPTKEEPKEEFKLYMPPRSSWTKRSMDYLTERGLSMDTIRAFDLYYCRAGTYAERIIVPVFVKGKPVAFQARTIVGEEPRYRMQRGSPKPWFNLDRYRPGIRTTIVEGPFDVMKMYENGIFAICPLGKSISEQQKKDLTMLQSSAITLLQDRDAAPFVGKTWRALNGIVDVHITPIVLADDPALLSRDDARATMQVTYDTVAAFDLDRVRRWRDKRVC